MWVLLKGSLVRLGGLNVNYDLDFVVVRKGIGRHVSPNCVCEGIYVHECMRER